MEIHIEPPSNDYATVVENIPYVFGALLVESLLFGIHCILYCICAYILGTRRNPGQLIILVAITVIFGVATADIALSYRFILHDVPAVLKLQMTVDSAVNRILPKGLLYVTNNLITDGLIIFRCYKVWGSRKYIMLVAGALLVADTVWGYLSVGVGVVSVSVTFTPVFFWSVLAFNIVMTLATAGRIWWVSRTARHILGKHQILRYHTAIAIIIESGAIYSAAILLLIVIPYGKPYRVIFLAISTRVVCIIPALMIVQVELGQTSGAEPRQHLDRSRVVSQRFSTLPPPSMTPTTVISVAPPSIYYNPPSDVVLDSRREGFTVERICVAK